MLFVSLAKERTGTGQEQRLRRAQWHYPEGLHVIGEYWLQTSDPKVILIAEADSIVPLMVGIAEWDDLYEVSIFPALTAEEGLEFIRSKMAGMQPA